MYQSFAEAYSWTPEQCERLPLEFTIWDPVIREAKQRVMQMRQAEAQRKQKMGR